ncbi:MAG: hypothetical protein M1825_004807 [Sarcosagium campestre]|nr:MAG: hypothetical protein M1825_004807 [Sarcosagium campestre]
MRLRHLHLPSLTPYSYASKLQESLVAQYLRHKAAVAALAPRFSSHEVTRSLPAALAPTILTAEFQPTYTCGRREVNRLSAAQIRHLRADGQAAFYETARGGQTTFHGPGQLVAYLILDLRAHGLSPRTYVRLLEDSVIAAVARHGIRGFTTENPGVWTSEQRKIAALGVHLRRNVASHGVAVNVSTDLWWFDRIVACGLEGKEATSMVREGVVGESVKSFGRVLVEQLASRLRGIEGVEEITELPADAV